MTSRLEVLEEGCRGRARTLSAGTVGGGGGGGGGGGWGGAEGGGGKRGEGVEGCE